MIDLLQRAAAFGRDFSRFAGRRGLWAAVLTALGALLDGAGIVLLVPVVAIVTGPTPATGGQISGRLAWALGELSARTPVQRLVTLLGLFALLLLARALVVSLREFALARLRIGFLQSLQLQITSRLAASRWEVVTRLRHSRISHLFSSDMEHCGEAAYSLLQLGVGAAVLVVQVALALWLSPVLATLALALLALCLAGIAPTLKRSRELGAAYTRAYLSLTHGMAQFLGGLKLALSQNRQQAFVDEFSKTLEELQRHEVDYVRHRTHTHLALTSLTAAVAGLAVLVGVAVLHAPAPVLIVLLLILTRMSGPVAQLQQGAQSVSRCLPAYEQVRALEDELMSKDAAAVAAQGSWQAPPGAALEFRGVRYRHPATDGATAAEGGGVEAVDLAVGAGEFVGVGGASGAGKTTLADLMVGLLAPQAGEIRVGGAQLVGATLSGWRGQLSYVSQDPFLFHDTIGANLRWANPAAREADLWDALRLAGAEELVRRSPAALETVVGERGALVSGGERQRLALARALLRRPALLVLDEAMSAIDPAAEAEILARLVELAPRPTIVMIAHRAESLTLCDRIVTLRKGRIVSDRPRAESPA